MGQRGESNQSGLKVKKSSKKLFKITTDRRTATVQSGLKVKKSSKELFNKTLDRRTTAVQSAIALGQCGTGSSKRYSMGMMDP